MSAIDDEIASMRIKLDRIHQYDSVIASDNFEPETVEDIKGNAKALCDEIKTEADIIKSSVDLWS